MDKAPDAFRTISEVADDLDVPQHVLRFWETRFAQIKPMKRSGGRRYYRPDDVDLLRGIRRLLYGEGYTIRGVQRILREQGIKAVQALADVAVAPPRPGKRPVAAPDDDETGTLAASHDDDAEVDDAHEDAVDEAEDDVDAKQAHDEESDSEEDDEDNEEEDEAGEDDEEEPVAAAPPPRATRPPAPDIIPRRDDAPPRRELPRANLSGPPPVAAPKAASHQPSTHQVAHQIPARRLSAPDAARLKAALDDLVACKKLVDDALKTSPPDLFPLK